MKNKLTNLTPTTRLMRIVAIALASIWLILGVIEQINPANFTSMYGLEVAGEAGLTYVRGIGARNIALAWGIIFAALAGFRAPLVAQAAGLAVMSLIEFVVAFNAVSFMGAIRFLIFAIVLAGLSTWIALCRRNDK